LLTTIDDQKTAAAFARALEVGGMAKAAVATALLKLPPLSAEAIAKLARDPTLKKYNPYHKPAHSPDGGGGRFTDADGAAGGAVRPVAAAPQGGKRKPAAPAQTPNAADAKAHPWKTRRNQKFRIFIAGDENQLSTDARPMGMTKWGKRAMPWAAINCRNRRRSKT
jgi:hypothetical protein